MANGFPCAICGFQETDHVYHGELSQKEIERVCGAFTKTQDERNFDRFDPNRDSWIEWAGYLGWYYCYD